MTIRWFTDADRQALQDAAEERRVLDELYRKYRTRVMTPAERDEAVAHFRNHREMGTLQIDPYRRS